MPGVCVCVRFEPGGECTWFVCVCVCVCVWFEPTQSPVLRHCIPGRAGFLLQIHSCPRVTTATAWNLAPHSRNSGQDLAKVPSLYFPIL